MMPTIIAASNKFEDVVISLLLGLVFSVLRDDKVIMKEERL